MPTTFTTIRDDLTSEEWPNSTHVIETRVDGDLADKIRARSGKTGTVLIFEDGTEGGHSEFTWEWDFDVLVTVGDHPVFARESQSGAQDYSDPWPSSALAQLLRWVDEVPR